MVTYEPSKWCIMIVVNKNLEISLTVDEVIVEIKQSNDIIELFALAIIAIKRINALNPVIVESLVETYPKCIEDWQKETGKLTDLLISKIES